MPPPTCPICGAKDQTCVGLPPMAAPLLKGESTMPEIVLDRPLYLTADKSRVVEEGDPEARYVLGGKGSTIDSAEAERLGLRDLAPAPAAAPVEGHLMDPTPDDKAVTFGSAPDADAGEKAKSGPAENKARRPAGVKVEGE